MGTTIAFSGTLLFHATVIAASMQHENGRLLCFVGTVSVKRPTACCEGVGIKAGYLPAMSTNTLYLSILVSVVMPPNLLAHMPSCFLTIRPVAVTDAAHATSEKRLSWNGSP